MIREVLDDIKQFAEVLLDCEQRVANADYSEELEAFLPKLAEQHAGMFAGGYDSDLIEWAPLKQATIKHKANDRILVNTGALMASLVNVGGSGNVHQASGREMLFGTEVDYATFHQDGTTRMPSRPVVGISEESLETLVSMIADATVQKMQLSG